MTPDRMAIWTQFYTAALTGLLASFDAQRYKTDESVRRITAAASSFATYSLIEYDVACDSGNDHHDAQEN